jgi:hypothetical protein
MSIETLTTAARAAGFAMAASEELLERQPPDIRANPQREAAKSNDAAGTMVVTRVQPSSPGWWAFWKATA